MAAAPLLVHHQDSGHDAMPCRHAGKSAMRTPPCGAAYHGSRTKAQVWSMPCSLQGYQRCGEATKLFARLIHRPRRGVQMYSLECSYASQYLQLRT